MQYRVLLLSLTLTFFVVLVVPVLPALALAQSLPMRITGVLLDPEDDPGEFWNQPGLHGEQVSLSAAENLDRGLLEIWTDCWL